MGARRVTNMIYEACEHGLISWESVAKECLAYMSEYDVEDMNNTAEFVEVDDEDDDN